MRYTIDYRFEYDKIVLIYKNSGSSIIIYSNMRCEMIGWWRHIFLVLWRQHIILNQLTKGGI